MTTMSGFNWLEELAPETRELMLAKAKTKALGDGTIISHQGARPRGLIQIISGEIRQCIFTEDGQEVLMYIYQPGDLVGDSTIPGESPFTITLVTRGVVEVRAWSANVFADLGRAHVEIAMAVTRQLSRRLQGAIRIVEELLTQPVAARIASRIYWMSDMQGASKRRVMLSLSQADLGLMVGATRQSVNRVLHELRDLKLIDTNYGRITVNDPDGLKRYISDHARLAHDRSPARASLQMSSSGRC